MNPKGFAPICAVIAAMPGTSADLAAATGMPAELLCFHLRDLGLLGAVRREILPGRPGGFVFYGFDLDAPRAAHLRSKPRQTATTLVLLLRALRHGGTSAELAEETGIHRREVQHILQVMRASHLARVAQWLRGRGSFEARWVLGGGPNAQKPRRKTKSEVNAEQWQRNKRLRTVDAINSALFRSVGRPEEFDYLEVA